MARDNVGGIEQATMEAQLASNELGGSGHGGPPKVIDGPAPVNGVVDNR